jgi:hypothetical protein
MYIVTRSPEGGDKPSNPGFSDFKALPKGREVGWSIKKPEEPKQQPSDPELEAYRQVHREPRGSTVFEGPLRVPRPNWPKQPGELRGEAELLNPILRSG